MWGQCGVSLCGQCVRTVPVGSVWGQCGDSPCGQCVGSVRVESVCGQSVWGQCEDGLCGVSGAAAGELGRAGAAVGRTRRGEGGCAGAQGGSAVRRGAGRPLTSHLLLQAEDDGHGLVQDEQFGLRLLAAEVQLAHAAELLKGLIDVSDAQALSGIIGHPALLLPLSLLLWGEKVVLILVCAMGEGSRGPEGDSEVTQWLACRASRVSVQVRRVCVCSV